MTEDKITNVRIKHIADTDMKLNQIICILSVYLLILGGEPDIFDLIWANLCESQSVYSCVRGD